MLRVVGLGAADKFIMCFKLLGGRAQTKGFTWNHVWKVISFAKMPPLSFVSQVEEYSWLVAFTSTWWKQRKCRSWLWVTQILGEGFHFLCWDLNKSPDKKHFICLSCKVGESHPIREASWGLLRSHNKMVYGQWIFERSLPCSRSSLPSWQSGYFS